MQNYTLTQTILLEMPLNSSDWITVYEPTVYGQSRYYGYIEDLRAYINVKSIPEAQLPLLDVTDTQTYKVTAIRDMEWGSDRKHMQLAIEKDIPNADPLLVIVAELSCLHRFPYYQVNLLAMLCDNLAAGINAGTRLKARMVNAGYGVLQGSDRVAIFGSAKEESFDLPNLPLSATSYRWTINPSSQIILPANSSRAQVTLVNEGESTIYLAYGNAATVGGIALLPQGGSYEINQSNPYWGAISAVSQGQSVLSGLEAVNV
jgi:hypothetical protein